MRLWAPAPLFALGALSASYRAFRRGVRGPDDLSVDFGAPPGNRWTT